MARRKSAPVEEETMSEVTAESYQEDPEWDGNADEVAEGEAPKKRTGRKPMVLPEAGRRLEKATLVHAKLSALDVDAEREKLNAKLTKVQGDLAAVNDHEEKVKAAEVELSEAQSAFDDAVKAVTGS
jgi:hypothetical protein